MSGDIPKAIAEATLTIGGYDLKCFILEDGRRVIEKESFENFILALEEGTMILTPEDATELAVALRELETPKEG